VSKERAVRRAEREAAAAALAEKRAAEAERETRRRARSARVSGWLPSSTGRQTGLLAERKRREVLATVALLVVVNLLVFAVARDTGLTALLLVASVLGAPILHMMLFRRS
jgi:hypothetical protein